MKGWGQSAAVIKTSKRVAFYLFDSLKNIYILVKQNLDLFSDHVPFIWVEKTETEVKSFWLIWGN